MKQIDATIHLRFTSVQLVHNQCVADVVIACFYAGPKDRGNVVMLHNKQYGIIIQYCHLKSFIVRPGKKVKRGDPLGIEGNTGFSFGKHCHNEWIIDPINPYIREKLLDLEGFDFTDDDQSTAYRYP